MATFKDDEGNEVTAFTAEEVAAQMTAKEAEFEAKYKPAEVGKPAADAAVVVPTAFDPEAFKAEVFGTAKTEIETAFKADKLATVRGTVGAKLDADTRKVFDAKFDSLTTGYADTPEGYATRAHDAYLLATGSKPSADFGLGNMMSPMGKANVDTKVVTDLDRGIRSALGISDADAEKFGKK